MAEDGNSDAPTSSRRKKRRDTFAYPVSNFHDVKVESEEQILREKLLSFPLVMMIFEKMKKERKVKFEWDFDPNYVRVLVLTVLDYFYTKIDESEVHNF